MEAAHFFVLTLAPIIVINILCVKTKDAKKMKEICLFSPRTLSETIRHKHIETKLNMRTILSNSNYRKKPVINQSRMYSLAGDWWRGSWGWGLCCLYISY